MSSEILTAAASDRAVNELWWIGIIEATLTLFFGISAIFWPGLTLVALVYLFSAFIMGFGIIQIVAGLMSIRRRSSWWVTVLLGVVTIGVGIYLVRNPDVSFATFILLVGFVLIVRGLLDIMRAFTDRATTRDTVHRTFLTLVGVAGIVAGILILLQPVAGGVAFVWILGLYALIVGTVGIGAALELRAALDEPVTIDTALAPAKEESSETPPKRSGRRRSGGARASA
jgi:uncharacterized membrane protein HdeD (DUF308 family)